MKNSNSIAHISLFCLDKYNRFQKRLQILLVSWWLSIMQPGSEIWSHILLLPVRPHPANSLLKHLLHALCLVSFLGRPDTGDLERSGLGLAALETHS